MQAEAAIFRPRAAQSPPTSIDDAVGQMLLRELLVDPPKAAPPSSQQQDLAAALVSRLNQSQTEVQQLHQQLAQARQEAECWRAQVTAMQSFLDDYGLVWVGAAAEELTRRLSSAGGLQASLAAAAAASHGPAGQSERSGLQCCVQALAVAIEQLNADLGAPSAPPGGGSSVVAPLAGGDAVALTLFSDGMQLGSHPARPYGDATADAILGDVLDGYMPSVLRLAYPQGAPLQLVDAREVSMAQAAAASAAAPSGRAPRGGQLVAFDQLGQQRLGAWHISKGDLLARLPRTVIRNGQLLDIRAGLAEFMEGPAVSTAAGGAAAGGVQQVAAPPGTSSDGDAHGVADGSCATLQIKSMDGRQTFVLKLGSTSTVADVRRCLDCHLAAAAAVAGAPAGSGSVGGYQLRAAFPMRVFDRPEQTLDEAGLVPTATLFMQAP